MKLILHLVGPPRLMGARQRCELGAGSLSVGRSPEADWVIPDTERLISRIHLRIDASHGAFVLTDTSANGVYVNGSAEAVGYGASVRLADGGRLRVGEAQIAVEIEARPPASAPDPASFAAQPGPAGAVAARLPDVSAEARAAPRDPLGGPFGGPFGQAPAAAERPAPRTVIDANWMTMPATAPAPAPSVPPRPASAPARAAEPDGSVILALRGGRASAESEGREGGPPSLLALVESRPDLTPERVAAAVDAAGQDLEPAARQALYRKIRSFLEINNH